MIKKQNKQILINMATGWLPVVSSMIIYFFLTPYMVDKMGVILLGVWLFINQLTGHLVLVQSVAGGAITKYVAEHHASNDNKSLHRVINTGIAEYLILAVVAAIVGLLLCLIAGKFSVFNAENLGSDFRHARIALAIMVANLVINLPFLGIRATIAGFQRYDFLNLVMTVTEILRAVAIVVVLACGYRFIALSLCTLAVSLLSNSISLIFLLKIHPFSFSRHDCQWSLMKTLFNFGFFSLITAVASMIFHRIDNIVIGAVLTGDHIFIYNVGISLLTTVRSICQPVISVLMPVASEFSALPSEQRGEKLEELFTRGSRFPLILTLPIMLFFIVFGREFISLWLGPKLGPDARQSHLIFVILALPGILTISWQAGAQMLIGLARHRFPAYLFCIAAVVNLGLSIIFIRYWGIVGVALGTAIPELLIKPIMHFYYKKVFNISMRRYYWNVWSRIGPLGLALTALMFFQKQYAHYFNLPELLLVAAVDGLLFWTVSYWILDSYERHVVRQVIKRVFKKP